MAWASGIGPTHPTARPPGACGAAHHQNLQAAQPQRLLRGLHVLNQTQPHRGHALQAAATTAAEEGGSAGCCGCRAPVCSWYG